MISLNSCKKILFLFAITTIPTLASFKIEFKKSNLNTKKISLQETLKKHHEAMGGKEKLDKIKTLHTKVNVETHSLNFESFVDNGEKYTQIVTTNNDKIITIFNDEIQRCVNGVTQEVNNENQMLYKEDAYIFRLYNLKEREWEYQLGKIDSLNKFISIKGVNNILEQEIVCFLDIDTFLLKRIVNKNGMEIKYFDYQEFQGVKYPMRFKMIDKGNSMEYKLTFVKFNDSFDNKVFEISTYCE